MPLQFYSDAWNIYIPSYPYAYYTCICVYKTCTSIWGSFISSNFVSNKMKRKDSMLVKAYHLLKKARFFLSCECYFRKIMSF